MYNNNNNNNNIKFIFQITLMVDGTVCGTTVDILYIFFSPCGAAAQRGQWPPHS
jgi:hypothetical protein